MCAGTDWVMLEVERGSQPAAERLPQCIPATQASVRVYLLLDSVHSLCCYGAMLT